MYSNYSDFDIEDLSGTYTDIADEVAKLPQRHSEVWDILREVQNRGDLWLILLKIFVSSCCKTINYPDYEENFYLFGANCLGYGIAGADTRTYAVVQ